jgi:hypothetical protein
MTYDIKKERADLGDAHQANPWGYGLFLCDIVNVRSLKVSLL